MKTGDKVICKDGREAVILHVYEKTVSVLMLKTGMYNPEFFFKEEVEVSNED